MPGGWGHVPHTSGRHAMRKRSAAAAPMRPFGGRHLTPRGRIWQPALFGGVAMIVAAIAGLSGCTATASLPTASAGDDAATRSETLSATQAPTGESTSAQAPTSKVLVVVEENHSASAVLQEM